MTTTTMSTAEYNMLINFKKEAMEKEKKLKEEVEKLKDENEKLKEEISKIPELLEKERYEERACNERDWMEKEEEENAELKEENSKKDEEHESQIKKLKDTIEDLKNTQVVVTNKKQHYFKLQKKCGELGLKAVGKKEVLIKRIEDYEQKKKEAAAMEAEKAEEAWVKEYLAELGPEFRDENGEYLYYIIAETNSLQNQVEANMVEASQEYKEEHGVGFPSIDDDCDVHNDVGVLADRLEDWFRSHGATDEDIKNLYDEGE